MSLRLKVMLSLVGTAVLLMATLHMLVERTLLPRFERIEREAATQATRQVTRTLAQRMDLMRVSDWARWDDAREFLAGKMPDFQQRNIQANTLIEMNLSVIVYTDLDGTPHLTAGMDPEHKSPMPVPETFLRCIRPGAGIWQRDSMEPRSGLLVLPEGILLLACAPVTSTDSSATPSGMCFFGRFLSPAETVAMSEATGLGLGFDTVASLSRPMQELAARAISSPGEPIVEHLANSRVQAYIVIKDLLGRPGVLVRAQLPRSAYFEGIATIGILSWQSLGAVTLLGAMTFLLFETLVLARISKFAVQLRDIAQTQNLKSRVDLYGRDEFAKLAQPVNRLLASLSEAQEQLQRGQQALETSEHRLSLALEAAGDGLWDLSIQSGLMYFSPTWARMMGYIDADVPTSMMEFEHVVHPEDINHLRKLLERHLAGETPDIFAEIRLRSGTGAWKWVLTRGRVVKRDAQKRPLRMIGTHQDVDARRLADDELRESRELFRNAFTESATGMAMVAPDGRFLRVNRVFCEFIGYTEDELTSINFQAITHPDDLQEDVAMAQELLSNRRDKYTMEKRYLRKDGTIVWALLNVGLVCDNEGNIRYFISQIQDITRRKRNEDELQAYTQRLFVTKEELVRRSEELATKTDEAEAAKHAAEDSSRTKSEFLANMSHEIRTPMAAILGYADLLLDASIPAAQRAGHVETIRRNGQHLLSLINDILDLSKIEAGKMMVEVIDCDPTQIVADVESLMRVRAAEKHLRFAIEHESGVPRQIRSDPTRLRQILLNLVSNAIKFTHQGEVVIRVKLMREPGEHSAKLRFVVADTGIGMDETEVRRLFTAFSQADASTTRKFGGTGLGLAISRRLVEMLGGTIRVRSTPGRGTQFELVIDAGNPLELAESPKPAPQPLISADPMPLAGRRILLAEDGADNQRLISFYLSRAGATVDLAENGRIALERIDQAELNNRPFDVVLMDMQMPELDGYAAATTLRGRGYTAPIIALTAHAMDGDRRKCINAGCSDYLTKPIDRLLLIQALLAAMPVQSGTASITLKSSLAADPMMQDLVQTYVAELPAQSRELVSLLNQHNFSDLKRLVHQIKGAGGGYGFDSISEAASGAEQAIKLNHDLQVIQAQVDVLIERIRSVEGYDRSLETFHAAAGVAH